MNLYPHGYSEDDLDEARAAGRREAAEGLTIWLKHKGADCKVKCHCGLAAKLEELSK